MDFHFLTHPTPTMLSVYNFWSYGSLCGEKIFSKIKNYKMKFVQTEEGCTFIGPERL